VQKPKSNSQQHEHVGSGYAGKEVEFSTVFPQGLATIPLQA